MDLMKRRIYLLLLIVSLVLVSCGDAEETESSKVDIQFRTGAIILDNYTITTGPDQTLEITGPSFDFTYYGSNGASTTLVISGIAGEITGRNESGIQETVDWSPDLNAGENLGEAAPNAAIAPKRAIVYGLPRSDNPVYSVELRFFGYFLGVDDPETTVNEALLPGENFRKVIRFNISGN